VLAKQIGSSSEESADQHAQIWMGHAEGDMSDHYDRSREDLQYPKDVAKAMGVGFDLRQTLTAKRTKEEKTSLTGVIGHQAETAEA